MSTATWAAPKTKATPEKSSPIIVWTRGEQLQSAKLNGGPVVTLRDQGIGTSQWNFSRDGRQLVFSTTPADVSFFNAGAFRRYVFITRFDGIPQLLLAAYGQKAVYDDETPDFDCPSFDPTGRNLVLGESEVGQFPSDSSSSWSSIYSIATRKRIFASDSPIRELPAGPLRRVLASSHLDYPALSPDGNDLVCLATHDDGDSRAYVYGRGQPLPPTRVVHFDLKHNSAEVLCRLDDRFSVLRTPSSNSRASVELPVRMLQPQFAWHPSEKKIIFVGPVSRVDTAVNLFVFDLKAHKLSRFSYSMVPEEQRFHTQTQKQAFVAKWLVEQERLSKTGKLPIAQKLKDDFSPQWSLDGKQVFWIRGSFSGDEPNDNRILRANADGSSLTPIFPTINGVTKIQLLSHLAPWQQYRKLSMEPLAGDYK